MRPPQLRLFGGIAVAGGLSLLALLAVGREPGISAPAPFQPAAVPATAAPMEDPEPDPAPEAASPRLVSCLSRYSRAALPRLGRELVALVQEPGGKELLFDVLRADIDAATRALALRILLSLEMSPALDASSLTGHGYQSGVVARDERLLRFVEETASSVVADPILRSAAIAALPFLPPARSESVFRVLLAERGPSDTDLLNSLTVVLRFDQSARAGADPRALERRGLSPEFGEYVAGLAARSFSDPASSESRRAAASRILSYDPDWLGRALDSVAEEPSSAVRSNLANAAGSLLRTDPDHPRAPQLVRALVGIAGNEGDPRSRTAAVDALSASSLRARFGGDIQSALLAVATSAPDEELRIRAVQSLARGRYASASPDLRALASDPSASVAEAARDALQQLR